MGINWKAIWRWISHLSTAQWVFSLLFPAMTLTAVFKFIADLPTALAIAFGILLALACFAVWHIVVWVKHQSDVAKSLRQKSEAVLGQQDSPIHIADRFYADCDHVVDEDGNDVPGVYSVALCLWVTNDSSTGSTLRNLSARFHFVSGEWTTLPIRDTEEGTVDLRHGQVALIEIGRVLFRSDNNSIPSIPRSGITQKASKPEIEYNSSPKQNYRSIRISNRENNTVRSIAQADDDNRFSFITIIVSADDTVSKTVRLQTNLFAEKANKWLQFLPEDYQYE